jgi:hypothetical protein
MCCFASLTNSVAHTKFMLLHDSRSDDGIKSFFQEVRELYIKVTNQLVIYIHNYLLLFSLALIIYLVILSYMVASFQ